MKKLAIVIALFGMILIPVLLSKKCDEPKIPKTSIAVFRFNSNMLQVEAEKGLLDKLINSDAFLKNRIKIENFCAEGDLSAAKKIAQEILKARFDMVVSISTPMLQVMARENKKGKVTHVFCAVTDPIAAGVGISGTGPAEHPHYMAGISTFQPVESIFRIARQMNPELKKVGVVWCTVETCSKACVGKARLICEELGIELVEMTVEKDTQVYDAAIAVCEKGVGALWIGGDNVVEPVIDKYVRAANKYRIPVLTNNPVHAFKGAMANLGANYFEVGAAAGDLVYSIISGTPADKTTINSVVPEQLFINDSVRILMKDKWLLPEELLARTDSIVGRISF
ncbi:MAG: hypothetical protein A2X18_06040 [Bacteroidetes bacterium GWF2_40_14]|nr:MAG: hypothetical protein A2X18_06040 [Bacteroidetes bacterium GWF2_40_14]